MSYLSKRYVKDPNMELREISGETVLIPVRETADYKGRVYVLNGIGARIWELISDLTFGEIKARLLEEYAVAPEELEADLLKYLSKLQRINVISSPAWEESDAPVSGSRTDQSGR